MDTNFCPLRTPTINTTTSNSTNMEGEQNNHLVDQFRDKHLIEVDGKSIPAPIKTFDEINLPTKVLDFIYRKKNFQKPTPIQMQAISCLLRKRDVIGLSSTGSGKTYAYLLPMCKQLIESHAYDISYSNTVIPTCLIILPTRELVKQVASLAEELVQLFDPNLQTRKSSYYQNQPNYNSYNTDFSGAQQYKNVSVPRHQQIWNTNQNTNFNYQLGHQFQNQNLHNTNTHPYCAPQATHSLHHNGVPPYHFSQGSMNSHHLNGEKKIDSFVVGLTGGVPIRESVSLLSSTTKVIVSTPGRLIDLCEKNFLRLDSITYFVLDECDRLLEMELEVQLRKIIAMTTVNNSSTQISLWSATLPNALERLARSAVVDPVYICTGVQDSIPSNIKQTVKFVHTYLKPKLLLETLREIPYPPILIFTHSKNKADEITKLLLEEQFYVASMHSDKSQEHRNEVMHDFINNKFDILVATDLVSRGLDIPIVTHVINFDLPNTIEDYIHRCGRTGRFGREGASTSFLTLNCQIAKELKDLLEATNNIVPYELNDTKMFGKNVLTTEMGDRVI